MGHDPIRAHDYRPGNSLHAQGWGGSSFSSRAFRNLDSTRAMWMVN